MNILLVDSSTPNCHVTIKSDMNWISINSFTPYDHTENILRIIDTCLKTLKLKIEKIDYVIIGSGPGSFTGVRISHSLIKGLFFDDKSLILPIPSVSLFAYSFFINIENYFYQFFNDFNSKKFCIHSMIFGKKNRFYYSKYHYNHQEPTKFDFNQFLNPEILDLPVDQIISKPNAKEDNLLNVFLIDDLNNFNTEDFPGFYLLKSHIDGVGLINFFEKNFESFSKFLIDPSSLLPLYIRKSDAEENFKQ